MTVRLLVLLFFFVAISPLGLWLDRRGSDWRLDYFGAPEADQRVQMLASPIRTFAGLEVEQALPW
jgi:hypothetical protein